MQLDAISQAGIGAPLTTAHSVVGQGDSSITVIQKNGTGNAYAASLFEATALTRLAAAAGARYEACAVMLTHGEKDAELPSYEDDIARLQSDYEQDLKAITGQTRPIPLILTQQHADPVTGRSTSTIAAWKAGVDHAGKIYCAGPKYQYAYAGDHIHLLAGQYDRLGVKYAEVFYEVVMLGTTGSRCSPWTSRATARRSACASTSRTRRWRGTRCSGRRTSSCTRPGRTGAASRSRIRRAK